MSTANALPDAIAHTLLIPLWARGTPSDCNPGGRYDPQAVRILAALNPDCAALERTFGTYGQAACLARERFVDATIRAFVAAHPDGTIVDMGCGLSTAAFRSPLARVQWYDVDMPAVIRCRQSLIPVLPRQHWIAARLEEPAWLDAVRAAPEAGTLFVASGVLQYLRPEWVKRLLVCMAGRFPGGRLCFDAASPLGLWGANRFVRKTGNTEAPMRFALRSAREVEGWSPRLRLAGAQRFFTTMPRAGLGFWVRVSMACMDAFGLGRLITVDFAA